MKSIRDIDIDMVLATFRLIDGKLHRLSRGGKYWKPMCIKLNKRGRAGVDINGRKLVIARLLFILSHGRDIRDGYLIDHIDNNPRNNAIDNLQELTLRDNTSKELNYNSGVRIRNNVRFQIHNLDGKQIAFQIGTYHDADEYKAVWLAMSPLFLFRQELKGKQLARDRLLEFIDAGNIVAARAWVKAFALAKGIEIKH